MGNSGNSGWLYFWAPKSLQIAPAPMKLKDAYPWKESYDQPRQPIKKQRHYFANKDPSSQSYGFSSSHVWMWELNHKESWVPKNWCFWIAMLEKTLESPLERKVKLVNPKGNQSWIFIGRTDVVAEAPIPWLPDVKNWLTGKPLMLGKIEGKRRRGWQRMGWLDGITDSMGRSFSKIMLSWWWTGKPGMLQFMGSQSDVTELHWTEWITRRKGIVDESKSKR